MAKSKKQKRKPPKKPDVKRITVDERFSDWSIRLLIANLAITTVTSDKKIEFQNINSWSSEKSVYVTRKNFKSHLGLGGNKRLIDRAVTEVIGEIEQKPTANLLWLGLEEGQVFVVGKFRIKGDRHNPEYLTISSTPAVDFLRIDRIERFKDNTKNLYSRALCGKEKSNEY
jgi:hypothetical protein